MIELDVEGRRIDLLIDDAEMERRKAAWVAPTPRYTRGYGLMFSEHVMQAQHGCDFDFLVGNDPVPTHAEMHSAG